jgi:hypothetical protein
MKVKIWNFSCLVSTINLATLAFWWPHPDLCANDVQMTLSVSSKAHATCMIRVYPLHSMMRPLKFLLTVHFLHVLVRLR